MNELQKTFARMMINEAYKAKKITGLPASIVAAQGILETAWGRSMPG